MHHVAYLRSLAEAQEAALAGVARETELLEELAAATGQQPVTASTTIQRTVLGVEALPAGALPADRASFAQVTVELQSHTGKRARVRLMLPAASAPPDAVVTGLVTLTASGYAAVRVRARLPNRVQVTGTGGPTTSLSVAPTLPVATLTVADTTAFPAAGTVAIGDQLVSYTGKTATTFTGCTGGTGTFPLGTAVYGTTSIAAATVLQDPVTGKRYATTGVTTVPVVGTGKVDVAESTSAEPGDVTYGTTLEWVIPPAGIARQVQVLRMAGGSIVDGEALTDVNGRGYTTKALTFSSSTEQLAGYLEATVNVVANDSDGASATVGAPATFHTELGPIMAELSFAAVVSISVPKGQRFTFGGLGYKTTANVTVGDSRANSVGFQAEGSGTSYEFLTLPTTVTMVAPPSGLAGTGSATKAERYGAWPAPQAPLVVGPPPELQTLVELVPGGRYRVRLNVVPVGT